MLNKLLKYDLKWIYKVLLVFYSLAVIFSILTRVFLSIDHSTIFTIIGQVSRGFMIGMLISIIINNLMRTWIRFVRNTYGDESYLTHTLPVAKNTIYLSKFLAAVITMLTSIVVIIVCVAITYYSKENLEIFKNSLNMIATAYDSTMINILLIIFAVIFLQMLFTLMVGYTGIIMGHKSNNNKMVKSVIYGFMIYMVTQGVLLFMIFIIGLVNKDIMNLFTSNEIIDIGVFKTFMYIVIIIYAIFILIYYLIDTKLLKKGVNVD